MALPMLRMACAFQYSPAPIGPDMAASLPAVPAGVARVRPSP
jgi:hypothetical protein